MTATATNPTTDATVNPDDPIKTHIVNCPHDKESAEAWLTEARIYGLPVEALCGHRWVPSRNPKAHPVCQKCLDEAQIIVADVIERRVP